MAEEMPVRSTKCGAIKGITYEKRVSKQQQKTIKKKERHGYILFN